MQLKGSVQFGLILCINIPKKIEPLICSSIQINSPELRRLVGSVALVYAFDQFHVLFAQLEIKYFKILLQSLNLGWLGDDHCVSLDAPSQNNLSRSFLVSLGQTLNDRKMGNQHFMIQECCHGQIDLMYFRQWTYFENRIIQTWYWTKPFSISQSTSKRSVSRNADSMLLTKLDKRITLEVWVCFNLIHSRLHFWIG